MSSNKVPTLTVFGNKKIGWYWNVVHGNGKILVSSSESFSTKAAAKKNVVRTRAALMELCEEDINEVIVQET